MGRRERGRTNHVFVDHGSKGKEDKGSRKDNERGNNLKQGARLYVQRSEEVTPRGSRVIGVNGAAARLVQKGDKVIIVTYCQIDAAEARNYHPSVVLLDDRNVIKRAA